MGHHRHKPASHAKRGMRTNHHGARPQAPRLDAADKWFGIRSQKKPKRPSGGASREAGDSFAARVVRLARAVPRGRVTTYGRIARAAGGGGMAAQSITSILGKAWDAGVRDIPFHRIVYADGRVWIDDAHRAERTRLYKREKISVDEDGYVENFGERVWEFG